MFSLSRQHDSADRRKVFVTITLEGKKASREKTESVENDMEELLRDLGPEDAQNFLEIMKKIHDLARSR